MVITSAAPVFSKLAETRFGGVVFRCRADGVTAASRPPSLCESLVLVQAGLGGQPFPPPPQLRETLSIVDSAEDSAVPPLLRSTGFVSILSGIAPQTSLRRPQRP